MLGASRWALGGGAKGAGVPGRKGARLRSLGVAGRVDGGAHSVGRGGDSAHVLVLGGCTHLGFRENAGPFAGVRATGSLEGARRVRDHDPSCRARTPSAHGNSNRERACSRQRGARSGTSRGSAARMRSGPSLDRIGPVRRVLFGVARWHRLVARRRALSKEGVERRASRTRGAFLSRAPYEERRPAARARTSYVLQTSTGRLRSQRSAHAASRWSKARAMEQVPVNGALVLDEDTARKRS